MNKTLERTNLTSVPSKEIKELAENTLCILANRRSCRSFTSVQLTSEEIDVLIQAGRTSPIGMNRVNDIQTLVIQNKSLLEELEKNTKSYYEKNHIVRSAIYEAPTLIIVIVKKLTGAYEKAQYCSAACILSSMIFAATEMGIGNIYLSGVTTALNQNPTLLTKVGIPDDYEAASAIAVGITDQVIEKRNLLEERIVARILQ